MVWALLSSSQADGAGRSALSPGASRPIKANTLPGPGPGPSRTVCAGAGSAAAMPQSVRVLRCFSCRLFQAQQVTKSRKWTCKACGEKQSFLRTYGEGSGADCRRHVQKLNLLQGQLSEESPRLLESGAQVSEEDLPLARHPCLQPRASESRWQKYLEGDSEEKMLAGDTCQDPGAASCQECPRKRKRSPSTEQPCPPSPTGLALGPHPHRELPATKTPPRDVPAAESRPPVTRPTPAPPCTETPICLWPQRLANLFQTGEDFDEDLLGPLSGADP